MIIGISGKAGAGKDALATYLLEFMPDFQRRKFADPLKQVAVILTGWPDQHSPAGKAHFLPDYRMTVGEFQQKLGTDAIRNHLHCNAWVIAALSDYRSSKKWIFTDVRFRNEAVVIRELGGILVRVNRKQRSQLCGRSATHESETALDRWRDWDFKYNNDGTLEQLRRFAADIAMAVEALNVKPMTTIEAKFALLWNCEQINGPKLIRQHKFHPDRKWRFDFAEPVSGVVIELEGGTWAGYQRGGARRGGWHQNPKVYAANCEKYNEAAFAGWTVFRLTTEQVKFDTVKRIALFCRRRHELATQSSPAVHLPGRDAGHAPGHAGGAGITP